MARAGLNRKSALATTTLVLAAEASDLDILSEFGGRVYGFAHHRGFTHTFFGVPFMAALVVLLVWIGWRIRNRKRGGSLDAPVPRWGVLFGLAFLAGLSHILLDYTNAYGVRQFAPLSYRWYSWDIVYIVEPVLWVILAAALVLPKLFGLVDSEIGARRKGPRGRAAAVIALLLVIAFWGFRDYEHRRALAAMQSLTYRGQDAIRVSAYPYVMNPFRWYGVVETALAYSRMDVNSITPEVDPANRAEIRMKPEQTDVVEAAKRSYLGRAYMDWAAYPVTEVEQIDSGGGGYIVRFYDLRYLYPDSRMRPLSAWVRLSPQLKVVDEDFGVRNYPGRSSH